MPFLMRWPARIAPGTVSDEPVISIDAFATILAASGVGQPADRIIDSRDILPAVTGSSDQPLHDALYWNWIDKDSPEGWAVRKGRWKLLADRSARELYDLEADISEARNVITEERVVAKDLLDSYKRWQEGIEPRIRRRR